MADKLVKMRPEIHQQVRLVAVRERTTVKAIVGNAVERWLKTHRSR